MPAFISCRARLEQMRNLPDGSQIFDAVVCLPHASNDIQVIVCSLSLLRGEDVPAATYDIVAKVSCGFTFSAKVVGLKCVRL